MQTEKVKIIVLSNEDPLDHIFWIRACERFKEEVTYRVVNLTSYNWFEELHKTEFDILLAKPSGLISFYKHLYDERISIICSELGYKVFPSHKEILIYENKRYLAEWLKANKIPHPDTFIFYNKKESLNWLDSCKYPILAKHNIGASGSGIYIIRNKKNARDYLKCAFSKRGAKKRIGPNFKKGNILKRSCVALYDFKYLKKRLSIYKARSRDIQRGYVIFQEYIAHKYEWRVVRIGDSFFAHKKLKMGEKASGTLLKNYDNPPLDILDFVKKITDQHNFYSQAIDIFESDRGYLVNEMQCIFGQSDPYQMLVNGKPGRFVYRDGSWLFEKGDFNTNESYDLRLKTVLELFRKGDF